MLREVWEETGYTVTQWRYCGIVTFISDKWENEHMHLFVCTDWTGQQIVCNEGDLEWIQKRRLLDLPMWEGVKIFLKLIEQPEPFFSLKLTYHGDELQEAVLNGKIIKT